MSNWFSNILKYKNILAFLGILGSALPVSAHEVYVLSSEETSRAFQSAKPIALDVLWRGDSIRLAGFIMLALILVLLGAMALRYSQWGRERHAWLQSQTRVARWILRLGLAGTLLFSAATGSLFGPELMLGTDTFAEMVRYTLYAIGLCALFPALTEVTVIGVFSLVAYGVWQDGYYLLTYATMIGLAVALLWMDRPLRFPSVAVGAFMLRLSFSVAIVSAAIWIKILHPEVSLAVIEKYNITQYSWLFPPDADLIVVGSAIVEIAIGLGILVGFQTRLITLITLGYMLLSLLFFRETVWPHLAWFATLVALFVTEGGTWTIDQRIQKLIIQQENELQWKYAAIEGNVNQAD